MAKERAGQALRDNIHSTSWTYAPAVRPGLKPQATQRLTNSRFGFKSMNAEPDSESENLPPIITRYQYSSPRNDFTTTLLQHQNFHTEPGQHLILSYPDLYHLFFSHR
jgi:hypothetical protein